MKYLILFLSVVSFSISAQKSVETEISEVNVFSSGAQVKRTTEVDLVKGKNSLVFQGLEGKLDANSIKIKANNEITVLFLNHQKSVTQAQSENQQKLTAFNNQIRTYKDSVSLNNDALKLLEIEESFFMKNQVVGGSYAGTKPEDLKATANFFKEQLTNLYANKNDLIRSNEKLFDKIKEVNTKVNKVTNQESSKSSEILVELDAELTGKQRFEISYFIAEAGWSPKYNIKVKDVLSPLILQYNADVFQYSGKDWKSIDFTLSSGKPRKQAQLPELQPWNWGEINEYDDYNDDDLEFDEKPNQVVGHVKDQENTGIQGVTVNLKGTSFGTQTDINGFYRINIPPNLMNKYPTLVYSFIGYKSQEKIVNQTVIDINLVEDVTTLEEVVVVGYGVEKKSSLTGAVRTVNGRISGVSVSSNRAKSLKKLVTDTEQAITKSFKLNDKFTVLSDARVYTASLEELEIPVVYEYRTIPKIDQVAFLNAHILDWESLNLMNGETSLFFEGTYLGKSKLELTESDTLSISLGRDESILIDRKQVKSYAKKKFMTNSIEEQFEFKITVRNTKSQPISILVEDQVPLSTYKEVEVFDEYYEGGIKDKETGKVEWNVNLQPNEKKELTLKYTVKYPKTGLVSY